LHGQHGVLWREEVKVVTALADAAWRDQIIAIRLRRLNQRRMKTAVGQYGNSCSAFSYKTRRKRL
jgi:hypothetical protein